MIVHLNKCPFRIGDEVIYQPSAKGLAADVMSASDEKLIPGMRYKIRDIQKELYIVVDGYQHPGGGIYWTEFELSK